MIMRQWLELLREADIEDWLSVFVGFPLIFIILMVVAVMLGD